MRLLQILSFYSFLVVQTACSGQQIQPTEEEVPKLEQIKSLLYQTTSPLFKPFEDGFSEPKPQNGVPWLSDNDKGDFETVVSLLEKNHEIKYVDRFGKHQIKITTKLPENQSLNNYWLSWTLLDAEITDSDGKVVKLSPLKSIESGSGSAYTRVNGEMVSENYTIVGLVFDIEDGENRRTPFQGNLKMELLYQNEFDITKVSAQDKGKTINLGDDKITILDIDKNTAVFTSESLSPNLFSTENINAEGHSIGLDFEKVKTLEFKNRPSKATVKVDQEVYTIFAENPTISKTDFENASHNYLITKLRDPKSSSSKIMLTKEIGAIETLVFFRQLEAQKSLLSVNL